MNQDHLIQKWLEGQLTTEEANAFEALEDAALMKMIVSDARAFKADQFTETINYQEFRKNLPVKKSKVIPLHYIRPVLQIASVFILGFAVYLSLFKEQLTQMETLTGEKLTLSLPDKSSVTVNAQSEISFNEDDWEDNRLVNLEGEAFFDVAKGGQFMVNTPSGQVTVMGTEFNVKQRGDYFEVQCFEGKVQVTAEGHEVFLTPGDNFRLYHGVAEQGRHSHTAPRWTNNISDFQRTVLSEVFAEMERQYGVTVTLEGVDGERLFTGGFGHDNLDSALKSVTVPLNLDFVILQTNQVKVIPREN